MDQNQQTNRPGQALKTKDALLQEVFQYAAWTHRRDSSEEMSAEFKKALEELLARFFSDLRTLDLPQPLPEGWSYGFSVAADGIELILVKLSPVERQDGSTRYVPEDETQYTLYKTCCKLLTPEEYGKRYSVEPVTVRQWIRRGKLRSALKAGTDWRIPELTDRPERGYLSGMYLWREDIPDLFPDLPGLGSYRWADFAAKQEHGKWLIQLGLAEGESAERRLLLDTKTKEKLELVLITHPLVEWRDRVIDTVVCAEEYEV